MIVLNRLVPLLLAVFLISSFGIGATVCDVHAKAKFGGKSFKSAPKSKPAATNQQPAAGATQKSGGFGRGLAGGLLGGALGAMLFGSMMGGTGMGLLPILILAGVGFYFFRKMGQAGQQQKRPGGYGQTGQNSQAPPSFSTEAEGFSEESGSVSVNQGIAQIAETDPGFDEKYFQEIASDVFFQVQAGWMRRDVEPFRHLLGDTLAGEYEQHFQEMSEKGIINKIESIAVRGVELVDAGSDGNEDFVTVLFTASLLDYTVDEKTEAIIEGSETTPIKFRERWTWARPVRTENWKLEGVHAE